MDKEPHLLSESNNTPYEITIDGWNVRPSRIFEGFVEVDKTRKKNDPLSIHIDPESGVVRKFAGASLYNPKIEKEFTMWNRALELFKIDQQVALHKLRRLKEERSKGYEEVYYLEMPYMGIRLDHYSQVALPLSEESVSTFTDRMVQMVSEHGVFFPDMNGGNVLVRIVDGKEQLFPIDWESAQTNRVRQNPDYYIEETKKRCQALFNKELYE